MSIKKRDIEDIIDNEALEYAMYTVQGRAIPNMIDGFKPVHRFIIHRALDLAKSSNFKKFHKIASIAGSVSDLGYHHTEVSAQDSGAKLANTWDNNFPLLDGQGNFGSRIIKEAGASRYIFARISDNFIKVYKDLDICPKHDDPEHIPPKFYLPLIPTVLLNGISGIAIGYATNILPHDVESVIECTKAAIKGKLDFEPKVKYPEFKGDIVELEDGRYELHGLYKFLSKTAIHITEIPRKWDRETYLIKILEPLRMDGLINYEEGSAKEGFNFKVKLRKEYKLPKSEEAIHNKIMKDFGLIEKVKQNITVINQDSALKYYETPSQLIRDFVEYRMPFVQTRIDNNIKELQHKLNLCTAKVKFIKMVVDGDIVINGKKRAELVSEIKTHKDISEFSDTLVSMNIYHMTLDEIAKLEKAVKECEKELSYWNKTTPQKEYIKDLEGIL